jgi:carboxymethylenebutenolidase
MLIPIHSIAYAETDTHIHFISENDSTPRAQFASGVSIDMVECSSGLELVMKKSSGTPACVRPESVSKLIERGWAIHVLPDYDKEDTNSKVFTGGQFKIKSMEANYFENYSGFVAYPEDEGDYPGIVMIHEWWGLNDNVKDMAKELASHGYVVVAVDLFGAPAATTADGARALVSSYELEKGIVNMDGAIKYLKETHNVQSIGSIGWCFGGTQSLNLALNRDSVNATVIYYGSVTSDKERLTNISWPVLGIFAELDNGITVESVKEFESSLNDLGIQNEIHIYPNVDHAFANPSGQRYAPEETRDAWQKTLSFLDMNL